MNSWTKCQGGRDGDFVWGQQHGLPFTKFNLSIALLSAHLPVAEINNESPIWHHSLNWSASYLVADLFITLNHFYFGGGRILFLLELTFTLYTDLPSMHSVPLPKLPSVDSQNISINMVFHRKLFLIKKTHFISNKVWQSAQDHGIYWSYHIPHHPKAAGLVELPLEDTVTWVPT